MLTVKKIENKETYPFLLEIHYAKRIPPISFAFGLFEETDLIGVVTYGKPVSNNLRNAICGKTNSKYVYELNRLCLKHNRKNEASFLVSKSLKMLPKPMVIVSYADTSQNHFGYIYQATNFIYTGLSAKRTDINIKGIEHLHCASAYDRSRGQENRIQWLKDTYGAENISYKPRPRKHRYVYFIGSNKFKKIFKKSLAYKIEKYPKKVENGQEIKSR